MIMTATAMSAGTFGQILRQRNAAQFNRLGDVLLHRMLQVMHYFLGIQKPRGHRIPQ